MSPFFPECECILKECRDRFETVRLNYEILQGTKSFKIIISQINPRVIPHTQSKRRYHLYDPTGKYHLRVQVMLPHDSRNSAGIFPGLRQT